MEKNKIILDFLQRNNELIEKTKWTIVDHWDADNCAIGFIKNDYLIYVSNYKYSDTELAMFDYQVEQNGVIIKENQAVSEIEIITKLKTI